MFFNSLQFAAFFIIVYGLYLLLDHRRQNMMLLAASYIFYGTWNWKFLFLIWLSTILDYSCGIKIHESTGIKKKKMFLFLSVLGNLSILGFFKYYNFFIFNLQELLTYSGFSINTSLINIILPVGISFYTFQTMSYTIDIYYNKIKPTRNILDFSLFVAFFPQLVAGPIETAKHLLPQISSPRKLSLEKFYKGCFLIYWGLFQKIYIADNLALIVDPVFSGSVPYNGAKVLVAVYAFAFQIFCDFAGYSNIAIGLGNLMGFDIMTNFNLPYFAANPSDFWKRWHISLSKWLKDYLYIPLGGNRKGVFNTYRNLTITMLLGGLWHGASWTFIAWGGYHGLLLILHRLMKPLLNKMSSFNNIIIKKVWAVIKVLFFFHLICLGWLIFRAQSIGQAYGMLKSLIYDFNIVRGLGFKDFLIYTWLLLIIEYICYIKNDLNIVLKWPVLIRFAVYLIIYILLTIYGAESGHEFIYFQF